MRDTDYFQRANAVVDLLPYVAVVSDFALKGGTALNYFFWDVPRLSVDIDLTFIPILERKENFCCQLRWVSPIGSYSLLSIYRIFRLSVGNYII